ncbi:DUF29 domain-containing protein [Cardiobacteriaceae bacterium TAE3-ERU3]|nr:DUF29 domain-containing protein [Cardiobacteriaceae bacterium TAE3-ERU3]
MKNVNADYHQDFYAWLSIQLFHLKNHNFDNLDLDNLIEEVEAMGRKEIREMKGIMIVLIAHLLKAKFQPEKNETSWRKTLQEQRIHLGFVLEDSPSLKNHLEDEEWMNNVWGYAVNMASAETNLAKGTFPDLPIWTANQILDENFPC